MRARRNLENSPAREQFRSDDSAVRGLLAQRTMRRSRVVAAATLLSVHAFASTSTGCAVEDDQEAEPSEETETGLRSVGDDGDLYDGRRNRCLTDATGSLTATSSSVTLGGSSTLRWSVRIPSGCSTVRTYLGSQLVGAAGSLVVTPQASSQYRLRLSISGYGERVLSTASVSVILPPRVEITSNDQAPLFVQAVQTPNTTVVVANHVQLNLSHREFIDVAPGVVLRGGRGGRQPGPRLFTTTRPRALFNIGKGISNVRITGVRIEGPDMGAVERNGARGIMVDSATNVRIDHNEISGWALAGIHVWDTLDTMASPSPTSPIVPAHTVNIHDNFIHHNQAVGGDGYGVAVGYGGHPMITRNVFDWNRHAIEGDGKAGTGYTATYNLVLENGGLHRWIPFPGFWVHTHQFDMHGLHDCGVWDLFSDALANCGPAGHTMLIRHNTFFYAEDNAIKLRGTPAVGMYVGENVFANHIQFDRAVHQNESGLVEEPGNVLGYNGKLQLGTCDFDGDGVDDSFMATGQSWWYRSGTTGPWEFLNASKKKLSEISLGYFDGDRRCDVSADGVLYPGGRPASPRFPMGAVAGADAMLTF